MFYWGKLIGVLAAIYFGGGWSKILLGLILGHLFDRSRAKRQHGFFSNQQTRQTLFFKTTFEVMGHISKAKGQVTAADISLASAIMDRMGLYGEARLSAQQAFREGKTAQYPLRENLQRFRHICFGRADLLRMFIEIQIQIAFADGELHPKERQVLYVIAEELHISRAQFDQFLRMYEGSRQFGGGYQQHSDSGYHQGAAYQQGPTLKDACAVLGVSEQDDALTIKRAYRKLMAEHHPDKLVAKGLPPEMMEVAKQKAQEIQAAYELIKRLKGFK